MYNRLYNFLEKKELIFLLQLGQKYLTTLVLIHIIKNEIDRGDDDDDELFLWYS